jgi:DNA-binding NtrC family response regulator
MSKILIVDDNADVIDTIQGRLELEHYTVATADNQETTCREIESFQPQLVVLDVYLQQGETGLEILKTIRETYTKQQLPVLILTGQPDAELCIQALKSGANAFITKPVDLKRLLEQINKELSQADDEIQTESWSEKLIGVSPVMLELARHVHQTGHDEVGALILGETGTGKDMVARSIHKHSKRANKPFIEIDCTVVPKELFETEVFGIEEKAATNIKFKKGRVEEADHGILFFNEIGDLPLEQQAKLLSFWEKKDFQRVGGIQRIKLDVMLIAATNINLSEMIANGKFRQDLYFRLQGNVIQVPSLREHKEDIPALCEYMIKKYAQLFKKPVFGMDEEAEEYLKTFAWEGNVRQLGSYIMSAVLNTSKGMITRKDLAKVDISFSPQESGYAQTLNQFMKKPYKIASEEWQQLFHKEYINQHLVENNWNVSKTSKKIGISREYLTKLMREHKIIRPA